VATLIPILLPVGVAFLGVLGVALAMARWLESSQNGARVADYIKLSTAGDSTVQNLGGPGASTSGLARLLSYTAVTAPRKLRDSVAVDLVQARVSISPTMFLGIRGVLLITTAVGAVIWILLAPQKSVIGWIIIGGSMLLAGRLPGMWLKRRIKKNRRAIEKGLPYALDLMVACLEGGLSLEATLDKVASENDSILSHEIRQTLAEITLGRPSAEALRDLGKRTTSPDLKRLTESVVQAERMGISIAENMRTLSDESRTRRRQRAEEEARKAPVKMLPILALCTLPAVGAILLTPPAIAIARLATMFGHH
jgi:tight adherence protein C